MQRYFKRWTTVGLLIWGTALFSLAQEGGVATPNPNRKQVATQLRWLGEQLNLTPEQKVKIKPLLVQEGDQIRAMRQNTNLSPTQQHERAKAIHRTFQSQISALLTPDQQERYKDLEKSIQEKHHQRSQGATPSSGTAPHATPQNGQAKQ